MLVCIPIWSVLVGLISPYRPAITPAAPEQFKVWTLTALLHDLVLLVRLSGMFALPSRQEIHLATATGEGPGILPMNPEQQDFRNVAEVETDATPVRPAILPNLVLDDVRLVLEAPRTEGPQTVWE